MLLERNMQNFERAAIQNLCPENADEAKALVPSLFTEVRGRYNLLMTARSQEPSTLARMLSPCTHSPAGLTF
jgi:hypothetical protein